MRFVDVIETPQSLLRFVTLAWRTSWSAVA